MDRSIRRLGAFLMALFCVLFVQLNYIQVFRADDLNTKPANRRPVLQSYSRPRGTVSTADGVIVAESEKSDDQYEYQRKYPQGELFGHVTGYFNYLFGATGLERAYNDELSGRTAKQQVRSVGDLLTNKDRTGNLQLTLRSDVQQAAKDALGDQKGTVVVLNPQTGEILALWSWPSFDPNLLSGHDLDETVKVKQVLEAADGNPLLAKSYREIYPPGSTFKVVTGSTGVQDGKVTPEEPVYPTLTSLDLPQTNKNLPNFGGGACGGTLFRILAKSCNTAFAQMGLDLGGPAMIKGAEAFGFNSTPPLDLPAVASHFPTGDFSKRLPVLAQSAIGQNEVAATPLQMALVASAIANDGVIMKPHVVKEIRDDQGDLVRSIEPEPWRTAVSPATADVMRQAMREVVAAGSATRLQMEGVDVGAKTGTAQFGPAAPLKSHAWVIAWAGPPGQKPTLAVAVIVEGQPGASEQTGGRVAAPIAKQVLEAALKPMPTPASSSTTTSTPPTTGAGG